MMVDNALLFQDALEEWLPDQLEPLTNADPDKLSSYVIALLKKEKPIAELKKNCSSELEVTGTLQSLLDEIHDYYSFIWL